MKLIARRILLVGFLLLLLLTGQAQAARLIVTIQGTRSADGYVYVALFSKPDGFPDGDYSIQNTKLKAAAEALSVVFDDLATGIYAVGAYHDENNNSRLDTDFIRLPDRRLRVIGWDTRGDQLPSVQRRCLCCRR